MGFLSLLFGDSHNNGFLKTFAGAICFLLLYGIGFFCYELCLHVCGHYRFRFPRRFATRQEASRRRPQFSFAEEDPFTLRNIGLDKRVIEALPTFVYESKGPTDEQPQCAICLLEFQDKEEIRVLSKCNHSFHVKCVDMWFHSHCTCPLCRTMVQPG